MCTLISRSARFAPALGVGRDASRPGRRRGEPAVERERLAARADGQVERQHGVDLVEPERRLRDAVGERDHDDQRQDRRQAGAQARP